MTAKGPYSRGERRYRRYRCQPRVGVAHTFSVVLEDDTAPGPAPSNPPRCGDPDHKHSRVVRAGTYGKRKRRQRYRCHPPNGDAVHRFTLRTTRPG